jgi:hypothetical protein
MHFSLPLKSCFWKLVFPHGHQTYDKDDVCTLVAAFIERAYLYSDVIFHIVWVSFLVEVGAWLETHATKY